MASFASADARGGARDRAMARLVAAMGAHPELVAGEGRACTDLMRATGGRAAVKTGAEAVFVGIVPGRRLGIALKIEDGGTRAAEAAITALLVPGTNGVHTVSITAAIGRDTIRSTVGYVRVAEPRAEYFGAEMRPAVLRQFADETGGRYYPASEAARLAEDIVYTTSGATEIERLDLWDMPAVFILLLSVLGAEWLYRRRRGLA